MSNTSARSSLLGRHITWTVISDYTWQTVPRRMRIEQTDGTRTGTVWSHGPITDTCWVIPDVRNPGEAYATCVHFDYKTGRLTERPADTARSTIVEQRLQQQSWAHYRAGVNVDRGSQPVNAPTTVEQVLELQNA